MRRLKIFLLVMSIAAPAWAYEVETHYDISLIAASTSDLVQSEVLDALGIHTLARRFPFNPGYWADASRECRFSGMRSIFELVACGAQHEDTGLRALHHFYDPHLDRPLTVGGTRGWRSPDWALQDGVERHSDQEFSYRDARNHFYLALTDTASSSVRDRHWGMTFRILGQVIHHIQDMAQPQHVRNDQHLSLRIPFLYSPSLYEAYTASDRDLAKARMAGPGSAPVVNRTDLGAFPLPRAFWENQASTGLAEWTNQSFVSAGTNFRLVPGLPGAIFPSSVYPWPVPEQLERIRVDDPELNLPAEMVANCRSCVLRLFSAKNRDGQTFRRAATYSVFGRALENPRWHDLAPIPVVSPFTLNRVNFDAAHMELLPRAVSYSAGLINYFFRGALEITVPDEGVYAVVDAGTLHVGAPATDFVGFRAVKAQIRNATLTGEAMSGGDLVAVAKFRRNVCYQNDLTDPLNAEGDSACRSASEEIVTSQMHEGVVLQSEFRAFTFDFSEKPIPINATDLYLQVVYRGRLGLEDDAVVVATKDIAEPSHVNYHNASDYIDVGGRVYTRTEVNESTALLNQVVPQSCVDYEVEPPHLKNGCFIPFDIYQDWAVTPGKPLYAVLGLPPRHYSSAALLLEEGSPTALQDLFAHCRPSVVPVPPRTFQSDPRTGIVTRSKLAPLRGVNGWANVYCAHSANAISSGDAAENAGSMSPLVGSEAAPFPIGVKF